MPPPNICRRSTGKTKLEISERSAGVAEVENNGAGWVSQAEGNLKVAAMGMLEVRAAP